MATPKEATKVCGIEVPLPIAGESEMVTDIIVFSKKYSEGAKPQWDMGVSAGVTTAEIVGVLDIFKDAILAQTNRADYGL